MLGYVQSAYDRVASHAQPRTWDWDRWYRFCKTVDAEFAGIKTEYKRLENTPKGPTNAINSWLLKQRMYRFINTYGTPRRRAH